MIRDRSLNLSEREVFASFVTGEAERIISQVGVGVRRVFIKYVFQV